MGVSTRGFLFSYQPGFAPTRTGTRTHASASLWAARGWALLLLSRILLFCRAKFPPYFYGGIELRNLRPSAVPLDAVQEPQPMLAVNTDAGQAVEPVLGSGSPPPRCGNPQFPAIPFGNGVAVQKQAGSIRVGIPALRRFAAHKCPAHLLCHLAHIRRSFPTVGVTGPELQPSYPIS